MDQINFKSAVKWDHRLLMLSKILISMQTCGIMRPPAAPTTQKYKNP